MMQDYSRTMELVKISERSAGATAAQADTYMQGMEASLNKITVAWEKFTTAFTQDGSLIIQVLDAFGTALDRIAEFGSTIEGQTYIYSLLATAIMGIVAARMASLKITLIQEKAQREELLIAAKKARIMAEEKIALLQLRIAVLQKAKTDKEAAKIALKKAETEAENIQDDAKREARLKEIHTLQAQLDQQDLDIDAELTKAKEELNAEQDKYNSALKTEATLEAQNKAGLMGKIPIIGQLITSILTMTIMTKNAGNAAVVAGNKTAKAGAKAQLAFGWISVVATALVALGAAISAIIIASTDARSEVQKVHDKVRNLNTEINHIAQVSAAIDTAINKYEELDQKIIKTTADLKDMEAALDTAADKLSEEEKAVYEGLTVTQKKEYLEAVKKQNDLRQQALVSEGIALLSQHKNNEQIFKDASNIAVIYETVNKAVEKHVDNLQKELNLTAQQSINLEKMAKAMIATVDARELLDKAIEQGQYSEINSKDEAKSAFSAQGISLTDKQAKAIAEKGIASTEVAAMFTSVEQKAAYDKVLQSRATANADTYMAAYVDEIEKLSVSVIKDGKQINAKLYDVFMDADNYSLKDVMNAYTVAMSELSEETKEAFLNADDLGGAYKQLYEFLQKNDPAGIMVDAMSDYNITANNINDDFIKRIRDLAASANQTISDDVILTLLQATLTGDDSTIRNTIQG